MPYLLNLLYLLAIFLASPYLVYRALRTGRYREGWLPKLFGLTPRRQGTNRCIWIHAVSVGEVQVAAILVSALRQEQPDVDIAITTTTKTGYDLARKRFPELIVSYAPLDFTWAIRSAIRRLRPDLILLTELEVWPNWLHVARRKNVQVVVFNGRLSRKSFQGYWRWRYFTHQVLGQVSAVLAQNATYAIRFRHLGVPAERIEVTGSLKFDGVEMDRGNPRTHSLRVEAALRDSDCVFLAGSTQAPEERICLDVFSELKAVFPTLRLILVPRHPERFDEVDALLRASGVSYARWTHERSKPLEGHPDVLLIDTVGDLRFWWGMADLAFVGGSLSLRGGQNMIEPAGYGAAICFGPNTQNFQETVDLLLRHDAARVVRNADELEAFCRKMLLAPRRAQRLGARARAAVMAEQGGTAKTVAVCVRLLGMHDPAKATLAAPHWTAHTASRKKQVRSHR